MPIFASKSRFFMILSSRCTGHGVSFKVFANVFGTQKTYLKQKIMFLDTSVEMGDQKTMS